MIVKDPFERLYLANLGLQGKKSTLLYRASRDGWKFVNFHTKCDKKGATLVLFKTDKNKRCGGYTSVDWHSEGKWESDESAFLFSLDLKKQILVKQPKHAIYCSSG